MKQTTRDEMIAWLTKEIKYCSSPQAASSGSMVRNRLRKNMLYRIRNELRNPAHD